MAKSPPPVQWRVLLDDDQWNAQTPSLPLEEEQGLGPRPHWLRRWPWILGGLALAALLLVGGFWFWARQELAVVQQGVEAALAQEAAARRQADPVELAATLDWNSDPAWQRFHLAQMQAEPVPSQAQVLQVDVQDDRALVLLRFTAPDRPTPWQAARVYRQTAEGWLHTQPALDLWGDQQTLETGPFTFHYYGRDAAAVQEAARLLAKEYTRLRAVLGLPAVAEVHQVVVEPTAWQRAFDYPQAALVLPSPLTTPRPEDVTPAQLLAQAALLYYITELTSEAFDRYGYGDYWIWSNLTETGLRNWLILESNIALQTEERDLLAWLRKGLAQGQPPPDAFLRDCQLLQGLDVELLIYPCDGVAQAAFRGPPVARLSALYTVYEYDNTRDASLADISSGPRWRRETNQELLAMITIYAYVFATYGPARFPHLLAALGQEQRWDGVVSAALDLEAAAFQARWQAWLP